MKSITVKKHFLGIVFSVFLLGSIFAQDNLQNGANNFNISYKNIYEELFSKGDYEELYDHLQKWETQEPNNPELYIGYFNYYINRNRFSGIFLGEQMGSPALELQDPETGEIVGYISESVQYNDEDIAKALEYLDKGLGFAPNRLDMYFGKIHLLNELELYERAGSEVLSLIVFSKNINNQWLWSAYENDVSDEDITSYGSGKIIEDGEDVLLESLQDYYGLWLNVGTDQSLEQMRICTEKQVELYPDHIFAYNVLAVYHFLKEQYHEALSVFLKAEKINANDCIVLVNIGIVYVRIGDNQKAEEYFSKVLEIGDEADKEYARYYLDQLQ